ncbi:hypothetical protein [Nannocystis pusilla]|uniref:hypothetical protein n=1 Tax=Nannocystis pusilla TaxID=889268 RepID=UPI003B775839
MAQRRSTTTELEPGPGWQLLITGALVFVGCDVQATAPAHHPYAPASVGDEWVYAMPQAHPAVQVPTTQSIDRILAAEQRGDRLVARVRSEFFGGTSERDLVISPLGVTPELGSMTSAVGEVKARVAEGCTCRASCRRGCAGTGDRSSTRRCRRCRWSAAARWSATIRTADRRRCTSAARRTIA